MIFDMQHSILKLYIVWLSVLITTSTLSKGGLELLFLGACWGSETLASVSIN